MSRINLAILLLFISTLLSGCELELLGEEAGVGDMALTDNEALMSPTEAEELANRYGIDAESLRFGRFVVDDQVTARSLFEDVKIDRVGTRNPMVYIKGEPKPIGELYTDEGKIKFNNGTVYEVKNNIFAVNKNAVYVRSFPSIVSNNIVSTLKYGHMVVKLGEVEDGWYSVEIMKNNMETYGYIEGGLLTQLIPDSVDITKETPNYNSHSELNYTYSELKNGIIKFPDENKVISDLIKNNQPNWTYKSLDDIGLFRIHDVSLCNDRSYLVRAQMTLIASNTGREYFAQVLMKYNILHSSWSLNNIQNELFWEILPPENRYRTVNSLNIPRIQPDEVFVPSRNHYYGNRVVFGMLNVYEINNYPIIISLDGKDFTGTGASITINNIPAGEHHLIIYFNTYFDGVNILKALSISNIYITEGIFTHLAFNCQTRNINSYTSRMYHNGY